MERIKKEDNSLTNLIDNFENSKYKKKEINNEELSLKFQLRNFSYPISLQTEENRQKYINIDYLEITNF